MIVLLRLTIIELQASTSRGVARVRLLLLKGSICLTSGRDLALFWQLCQLNLPAASINLRSNCLFGLTIDSFPFQSVSAINLRGFV